MSQQQLDITNPKFSEQARATLLDILLPHLALGIAGRGLDDQKAYEILCYASVKRISIESACLQLADAPSGNTLREHLQGALEPDRAGLAALEAQINQTLRQQLPWNVQARLAQKPFEIACDLVEIPYHGQAKVDAQEVRRGAPKAGTTHFHMYASLAIVHHHQRLSLAVTFVWQGETMEQVLTRLLAQARQLAIRIERAYLDKGFCSVAVLRRLRRQRVPYVIPIPQRGGEGGIKALCQGRRSYQARYTFKRGTRAAYTTDVVIVCKYSQGRFKKPGLRYFAYAVYQMDELTPQQIFQCYRRRFSIESGYRQLHQVRARTCSRNPALRLLLVGLAMLIVNLWVLFAQTWVTITSYGWRVRLVTVTLVQVAEAIADAVKELLGVIPVLELDAVIQGAKLIS